MKNSALFKLESWLIRKSGSAADVLLLIARCFLAFPFVVFGTMKYINMGRMQAYIEAGGLPGEVIWAVIPLQVLCGLAVAIGMFSRIAAVLLCGFCILATSLYHTSWSVSGELASFTKDFATAGGFIFLIVFGPGRLSFDFRLREPVTSA